MSKERQSYRETGRADPSFRIGQGIDVHRFVVGRRLVLGGVEIQSDVGLDGHSDADVVLHALIDSLLGAAALPDIGCLFPNTDPNWKDSSSLDLLRIVWTRVLERGWEIGNLDITVLAEQPKISPYVEAMKRNISKILGCEMCYCNIKATTCEGLGFIGRREGILASCVALLVHS